MNKHDAAHEKQTAPIEEMDPIENQLDVMANQQDTLAHTPTAEDKQPSTEFDLKASDRDVIYALRSVHQTQVQLNSMADQKANILTGAIVIILTMAAARIPGVLESATIFQQWMIACLGLFQVAALIVSILVLMPKVVSRIGKGEKTTQVKDIPNPFFFGFFTQVDEDTYVDFIINDLNTNFAARKYMGKDIYQNGRVLDKKYKLLRLAFILALTGALCGVASFGSVIVI